MTRPRGDDGHLLLLVAFFGVVLVVLAAVVVDASAAFLARRELASAADGAALAAAQHVDLDAYYAGNQEGDDLPLADAQDTIAAYVPSGDTIVTVDLSGDGTSITVTLSRHVPLPFSPPGYGNGIDVQATATARLPVRR